MNRVHTRRPFLPKTSAWYHTQAFRWPIVNGRGIDRLPFTPPRHGRPRDRRKESRTMKRNILQGMAAALTLAALATAAGCGSIADKDRIRVARLDDTYITRGDLKELISDMPDKERPNIRN